MSLTIGRESDSSFGINAAPARTALLIALAVGFAAGLLVGPADATASLDVDLTRLLRAMAVLKLLFVGAAVAVTLWRMQTPIMPGRLTMYVAATAVMATGPGLIWTMAHVALGAALLHIGLIASCALLWRDPEVRSLLAAAVARRRARATLDPAAQRR